MVQVDRDLNRRLMMLGIFELAPDMGTSANAEELKVRLAELGGDPSQVEHDELRQLADMGWLDTRDMTFGDDMGSITPRGRDVAAEIMRARQDVARRRIVLRDVLLRWLYDQIHVHDALMPNPVGVLSSGVNYLGVAFTEADVAQAATWLREAQYIEGTVIASGEIVLAKLTTAGTRVVELGHSVMDVQPGGGTTFNTTVHGSANVANQSPGSVQSIDQSRTWIEVAREQLDAAEQAAATFKPDIQADVAETIAEVRSAVDDEDQPRARAGLERLLPFLSSTSAGALGNLVSAGLSQLLGMLG